MAHPVTPVEVTHNSVTIALIDFKQLFHSYDLRIGKFILMDDDVFWYKVDSASIWYNKFYII